MTSNQPATTTYPLSRGHWASKGRGAVHFILPGRKAVCGTHMGYGLLDQAWPSQRQCQRCAVKVAAEFTGTPCTICAGDLGAASHVHGCPERATFNNQR